MYLGGRSRIAAAPIEQIKTISAAMLAVVLRGAVGAWGAL